MRGLAPFALALAAAALGRPAPPADKISDGVVKIGVLTDMTGYYSDLAGPGSAPESDPGACTAPGAEPVIGAPRRKFTVTRRAATRCERK